MREWISASGVRGVSMAARYSVTVAPDQTPSQTLPRTSDVPGLPHLWLLSDARNDAALERSIVALPPGSGFVYRHYHLAADARRARFAALAALARRHGHLVILSDDPARAAAWEADGVYGPAARIAAARGLSLSPLVATAHDEAEIEAATRTGASAIMLSPVFATRSHPGAAALGVARFHALANHSSLPLIALGGMDRARAQELGWTRWAAIDGLSAD